MLYNDFGSVQQCTVSLPGMANASAETPWKTRMWMTPFHSENPASDGVQAKLDGRLQTRSLLQDKVLNLGT